MIFRTLVATLASASALYAVPAAAQDRDPFNGPHVGIELTRDSNQATQAGAPLKPEGRDRKGLAVRGHVGYDFSLAGVAVAGVEAGIGTGGRTVSQPSLAGGTYRLDPALTYDLTARAGFVPTEGVLVYGRGGYRWLKTRRIIADQLTGNGVDKVTEKGFTYGGGLEYAATQAVSLRAEFMRTNFDRRLTQNKVALGLSYRF